MYPRLSEYLDERAAETDRIPEERRAELEKIAAFVRKRVSAGQPARLTFVCTHNSRRSHMSQLWALAAAARHGVSGVETFSGGTEATAFNPRAVAAMRRAGFRIERTGEGSNPVYEARHADGGPVTRAFSKIYDQDPNPKEDFAAVMTCTAADQACPAVRGAALRVAIPYEDPKAFDGTETEAAAYDERSRQIGREMLYLFSRVAAQSNARR